MTNKRTYLDKMMAKHSFKQFDKGARSSFSYWFNHWKAFNLTAYYLGVWKFKYLFHDIEKPWMKLFCDYKTVQKWHRTHNRHHAQYKGGIGKIDWEGLIIDNECSRYTKKNAQLNATDYVDFVINEKKDVSEELRQAYIENAYKVLHKFDLHND